jgi:hypothetical protein
MTEQSIRPTGENRSQADPVVGQVRVPDRENPAMDAMECAGLNLPCHRAMRVPERPHELANGHHPVLAGGQRRQFPASLPA